ncbi:hypothetical protein SKAU_G00387800 [Synaphobranchus kaupii]|uniref:Uncharacterized protein n=1 Tax=Synaphobranchus kaupii TaxID=118154 RepID=A0A9Q1EAU5_SYNKA|nr:hypothetical protein SKAU_G00387800 [Synaphobranchus kaupii]
MSGHDGDMAKPTNTPIPTAEESTRTRNLDRTGLVLNTGKPFRIVKASSHSADHLTGLPVALVRHLLISLTEIQQRSRVVIDFTWPNFSRSSSMRGIGWFNNPEVLHNLDFLLQWVHQSLCHPVRSLSNGR